MAKPQTITFTEHSHRTEYANGVVAECKQGDKLILLQNHRNGDKTVLIYGRTTRGLDIRCRVRMSDKMFRPQRNTGRL